MTCIGNSGPLPAEVSAAVNADDLAVVSVLSGNRNFEGRINPDVKMNYLASPPLVVAYALAGTMDFDFATEPLGDDHDGNPVFLRDIWPSPTEIEAVAAEAIGADMFRTRYADVFAGDDRWRSLPTPVGEVFEWDDAVDVRAQAPVLRRHPGSARAGLRHRRRARARQARRLGHHRPHQPGRLDQGRQPGGASTSSSTAWRPRTSTRTARAAATTR